MKKTKRFRTGFQLIPIFAECKNVSSFITLYLRTIPSLNKTSRRDNKIRFEDEFKDTVYKFSVRYANVRGNLAAYTDYVNKNRLAEGKSPNFVAKSMKGCHWYNEYGLLVEKDDKTNYYLRYYYHNAMSRNNKATYAYEDGTLLSPVELAILQDYLPLPSKKNSGRQGTEKKEIPNNVMLDNILQFNFMGVRYRKI
jgi:hypothetical protein